MLIFGYISCAYIFVFLSSQTFYYLVVAAAVILWKTTEWSEQKQPSTNIVQLWAYANAMDFMFRLKVSQKKAENVRVEIGHEVQETVEI